MDISRNRLRHLCVATLVLALAGCVSQSPPKPDEAKVKQFVIAGNSPEITFLAMTRAKTSGTSQNL
jgi:ABC-type cobalamin/Fe3+-siderophores transport system ATPase subunit